MTINRQFVFPLIFLAILGSQAAAQITFRQVAQFDHPGEGALRFSGGREVEFSENGEHLIAAFYTSRAQLFDLKANKPISPAFRTSGDGQVGFVNNEVAYTADWTSLKLWNAKTGEQIGQAIPHELREDTIIHPAISLNGKYIATRTTMTSFRIWDAATRQPIGPEHPLESEIGSLKFSANNQFLFVRAGEQLFVSHPETGKLVAGPFATGWKFYHFPKQQALITTDRAGQGQTQLVIRSTAQAEWPEVYRSRIAGRLKQIVPLGGDQYLVQATNADFTPELFTFSIDSPKMRTPVESSSDRAFSLIVAEDKRRWISSNIRNISCQKFGQSASAWELKIPASGYDYRLFPFDRDHFLIHDKQDGLAVHKISDGSQVWSFTGVIRFDVHDGKIAIGNQEGVEIWVTE